MNQTFTRTVKLLGVVGKKATGTLDNGSPWSTDRVELHCFETFRDDDYSFGGTVVVHKIDDRDANLIKAKELVGKEINLEMSIDVGTKLGAAPKLIATGFHAFKK